MDYDLIELLQLIPLRHFGLAVPVRKTTGAVARTPSTSRRLRIGPGRLLGIVSGHAPVVYE